MRIEIGEIVIGRDACFIQGLRVYQGDVLRPPEIHPLFKFARRDHALSMVEDGTIRISTLHEFQDWESYSGEIFDAGEGKVHFVNEYSHYAGRAGDANGLLRTQYKNPDEDIDIRNQELKKTLEAENLYIYSTSRYLFTESLWQAKKDKHLQNDETGCTLITNPQGFFHTISDSIDKLRPFAFGHCNYSGRTIREADPGPDCITNRFIAEPVRALFVKPENHRNYMEHRAIWKADDDQEMKAFCPTIPELCDHVIEVDVTGIDLAALEVIKDRGGGRALRLQVHLADQEHPSWFGWLFPHQVFTPIIYDDAQSGTRMLGFRPRDVGNYDHLAIHHCGIYYDLARQLFCINELERITKIELIG